jgi:hypothetical protein
VKPVYKQQQSLVPGMLGKAGDEIQQKKKQVYRMDTKRLCINLNTNLINVNQIHCNKSSVTSI